MQALISVEHRPVLTTKHMPIHIIEDLSIIFNKWEDGDLSILPGRGLRPRAQNSRAYPIPGYELRRAANVFGHKGLVNGQLVADPREMYYDGAHGLFDGGIYGRKAEGAFSIAIEYHKLTAREYYADVDCGETIWYMVTALPKTEDMSSSNIEDDEADVTGINDQELATRFTQYLTKN
jgi:hypothetical protein